MTVRRSDQVLLYFFTVLTMFSQGSRRRLFVNLKGFDLKDGLLYVEYTTTPQINVDMFVCINNEVYCKEWHILDIVFLQHSDYSMYWCTTHTRSSRTTSTVWETISSRARSSPPSAPPTDPWAHCHDVIFSIAV